MQKIVQKMKTRYNIIRKIAMTVCALGMMAGTTWGEDIKFTHSKGKLSENNIGILYYIRYRYAFYKTTFV